MAERDIIKQAIKTIDSVLEDPHRGLPEDVFLFASRITPMINVDLLVKNERNQALLTWRDDGYSRPGWHIPGGIIRYRETIAERIRAVARNELGAEVQFQATPLAMNELFNPVARERGHFISLLYRCSLTTPPEEGLRYRSGSPRQDQWMWHDSCPADLIAVHEIYRKFI